MTTVRGLRPDADRTLDRDRVTSLGFDRRTFLRMVGGGIAVIVTLGPDDLFAQGRRAFPEDLNAYLRTGADGRVTVFTGKIEMGQGDMTSQAQMAADELGVALSAIDKFKTKNEVIMLMVEDVYLTPNPHALKFILNQKLLNYETREYADKESAMNDPFATGIFALDGVVSVFYMDKFVTIEKSPEANWAHIQRPFIDFLKSFDPDLIPNESITAPTAEEENALLKKINQLLDQKVRPALAGDGGGLQVLGIEGFTVKIRYQGACGSCPSSITGTLMAIEGLLKRDVNPSIHVVAA